MLVLPGLSVAGSVRQAGDGYSDQLLDMDVRIQGMTGMLGIYTHSHVNKPILTLYYIYYTTVELLNRRHHALVQSSCLSFPPSNNSKVLFCTQTHVISWGSRQSSLFRLSLVLERLHCNRRHVVSFAVC